MSQMRFHIVDHSGKKQRSLVRPDRDGQGVFFGIAHVRGVVSRDQARELADNIHDWLDQQEQNNPTPKETV